MGLLHRSTAAGRTNRRLAALRSAACPQKGRRPPMRFSLLLLILSLKLRKASRRHPKFKRYISTMQARILIKTADGRRGRLFIFDKGNVSSMKGGNHQTFDVALVWADPASAYKVMVSGSDEASFKAAAGGKLMVVGVAYYAQWFTEGVKLIL
jgi:hypothetical protein